MSFLSLQDLAKFPLLTSLNLHNFVLSDDLIGVGTLQNLKKLQLTWCRLSDAMITEISQLECLEELELTRIESLDDDEKLARLLHNLTRLRTLKIHG